MNTQPTATDVLSNNQYYVYQDETGLDIASIILSLGKHKRLLASLTSGVSVIFVILAMLLPPKYQVHTKITTPDEATVTRINNNTVTPFSTESLFKQFYEESRSSENISNFLERDNLFAKLYDSSKPDFNSELAMSDFLKGFESLILEPKAPKDETVTTPTLYKITLTGKKEDTLVAALNAYIVFVNEYLIGKIEEEQKLKKAIRISTLDREIEILLKQTKDRRELSISRMKLDNEKRLKEINQQIELILEKAKLDKATEVAELEEALKLAKTLGIKYPTQLNDVDPEGAARRTSKDGTEININEQDVLPLYLMGTEFLNNKIELLKSRENERIFLAELNALETEKQRIINDIELATLINRKNDLPFIAAIPEKMDELTRLKALKIDFKGENLYQIDRKALVTGENVGISKSLVIAFGLILGLVFAVVYIIVYEQIVTKGKAII